MRRLTRSRLHRTLFTSLLLLALASRAMIPTGFMPSASGPFSITICHGGTALHDHSRHPGDPGRSDHCQFGAAPAVGPISEIAIVRAPPPMGAQSENSFESRHPILLRGRAHPPRGPPSSLSYA